PAAAYSARVPSPAFPAPASARRSQRRPQPRLATAGSPDASSSAPSAHPSEMIPPSLPASPLLRCGGHVTPDTATLDARRRERRRGDKRGRTLTRSPAPASRIDLHIDRESPPPGSHRRRVLERSKRSPVRNDPTFVACLFFFAPFGHGPGARPAHRFVLAFPTSAGSQATARPGPP